MMIRGVLLDIAGVLVDGAEPIPGALEAVDALRREGMPFRLVTNTSRRSKRAVFEQLRTLGFDVAPSDVFTGAEAVAAHLRSHHLTPFLLVHPALEDDFADLTGGTPDAVVIGDAADRFTYDRLNAAFRLLIDGAPLLAIATNRYFKDADGLSLDAGPFVTALEYAAQVRAEVFGKPAPAFLKAILADLGCAAAETVMIGDDVEADVNGALAAGLHAILVKTGKYRSGDEARISEGGACAADVQDAIATVVSL